MLKQEIHALWDVLADIDASQTRAASELIMTVLAECAGLLNVTWAGAAPYCGVGGAYCGGAPISCWYAAERWAAA